MEDHFWWYKGLHRLVLERIADALPEEPRDILDAGCGTGGMLRKLAERYPAARIRGFDFSPHAVTFAAERTVSWAARNAAHASMQASPTSATSPLRTPDIARASVSEVPFPEASFDLVVSLDVLYHAGVEDDVAAMDELRRVLHPGGTLLLNLPAFESLRSSHDRAIHTARRYSRRELSERLLRAGLEPFRVHYWNGFLFPALAAVRWLRRRDAREDAPVAPSDVRPLPAQVNRTLETALAIERGWLRTAPLPFGLSVLALARRPRRDIGRSGRTPAPHPGAESGRT
ncbi:MAG: class I SAM-dependent methyltransferase [Candidatus Eisenbacteria bacterium]